MFKKQKEDLDTIVVYWSDSCGFDRQNFASFFSHSPIPIIKTLPERDKTFVKDNFGYRSCRGMFNLFKNTYVINSPVTSTVKLFNTENMYPDKDDGGTGYWSVGHRPLSNSFRIDLDFGYVFFTEEDLNMRVTPPYMHKIKSAETAWIAAGSYNISKWLRPIFPSYILWENETQISIIKDQPSMYIEFETNKKIIFKRFEMANEIVAIIQELMLLRDRNSIASLNFLYSAFQKSYRNKKVIKLIKENILE